MGCLWALLMDRRMINLLVRHILCCLMEMSSSRTYRVTWGKSKYVKNTNVRYLQKLLFSPWSLFGSYTLFQHGASLLMRWTHSQTKFVFRWGGALPRGGALPHVALRYSRQPNWSSYADPGGSESGWRSIGWTSGHIVPVSTDHALQLPNWFSCCERIKRKILLS